MAHKGPADFCVFCMYIKYSKVATSIYFCLFSRISLFPLLKEFVDISSLRMNVNPADGLSASMAQQPMTVMQPQQVAVIFIEIYNLQ